MRSIRINASEMATCINRNPYEDHTNMLYKYFQLLDPEGYARFKRTTGTTTQKEHVASLNKRLETSTKKQLDKQVTTTVSHVTSANKNCMSIQALESKIYEIHDQVKDIPNLTCAEKELLTNDLTTKIFTEIGIKNEPLVLQQNAPDARTDSKLHIKHIADCYAPDGTKHTIIVQGRVDAIEQAHDGVIQVVEIKNRMRRLFGYVKDYEYVQVMCYMYLLNAPRAKVIERLEDKSRQDIVAFDDEEWCEIKKGIIDFCQKLLALLYNNNQIDSNIKT